VIRLDGVSHRYGDRPVLRDITLDLDGPRIAIIGANGSGKSTLARVFNGLVVPTAGTVTVDGLDTRRDGAAVRRKVGFVFTDPDAQIVMPTVAEDVAFSLRRKEITSSERDEQVREVLTRFGLEDHADHPAHLLSGGQKQLLALASVLVTEPDVLVCDEPTTLLDLRNTRIVSDLIHALPQRVILVTHDLDEAKSWPRVVVIDEGQVVADGSGETSTQVYRELMADRR
jgi:biotin transport system ATP-binding protein